MHGLEKLTTMVVEATGPAASLPPHLLKVLDGASEWARRAAHDAPLVSRKQTRSRR